MHDQPTVRLIPAAVLEPRIRLVENGDLIEAGAFDLAAILAEDRTPNFPMRASPQMQGKILSSFEASRRQNNRFNAAGDDLGAYYAGTTLPAAIHEIKWHLENDTGVPFDKTRVYRVVTARVSGKYLDLRETGAKALSPDVKLGYLAGQDLARRVRGSCDGILYPSARHPLGICVAAFKPDRINDIKLDRFISFERVPDSSPPRFGYRSHLQQHRVAEMMQQFAIA